MKSWSEIPVHIIPSEQNLIDDLLSPTGFLSIPAYISPRGLLRRQCTNMYKIQYVRKFIRSMLGLKRYQHMKQPVLGLYGISANEAKRAKPSREKWVVANYPLVEGNITRSNCLKLCDSVNIQRPRRSTCICCPLHSNTDWAEIKGNGDNPTWNKVIEIDQAIRNRPPSKMTEQVFLHHSYKPIEDVDLNKCAR